MIVIAELPEVVQRLKQFEIAPSSSEEHLVVQFKTKDDNGWYVYEFSVWLKGRPKLRGVS